MLNIFVCKQINVKIFVCKQLNVKHICMQGGQCKTNLSAKSPKLNKEEEGFLLIPGFLFEIWFSIHR